MERWVVFASGSAKITVPGSKENATIKGGPEGLLLATDISRVSEEGHETEYDSENESVILMFPVASEKTPKHKVLHKGGCQLKELRELGEEGKKKGKKEGKKDGKDDGKGVGKEDGIDDEEDDGE